MLLNHGWAQPWPDNLSNNNNNDDNLDEPATDDFGDPGGDPDLPIDSNILILVAGGVGYGLKKSFELKQTIKRKNQLQQNITAD